MSVRARFYLTAMLLIALAFPISSCARQREADRRASLKLPFGGVNTPVSQQIITGKVEVTGWALSEEGIASVSLYIDRTFVADCVPGLPRPDVANAYPNMASSNTSGWTVPVDPASFAPGWHELTVQAKSKQGATRDLASFPILIQR